MRFKCLSTFPFTLREFGKASNPLNPIAFADRAGTEVMIDGRFSHQESEQSEEVSRLIAGNRALLVEIRRVRGCLRWLVACKHRRELWCVSRPTQR
jgi:hypothetical protein